MDTASKARMLELAAKAEKATGPDRELDGLIEAACERYPEGWSRDSFIENALVEFHHVGNGRVGIRTDGGLDHARWNAAAYTASLDAAMTLVPEGGRFSVSGLIGPRGFTAYVTGADRVAAATPALALTAAALRARSEMEGEG